MSAGKTSSAAQIAVSLQATRKSNEIFETLATQIVTHIQNNFHKTYAYHQFDTALLAKFEPIFYSFLTHSNKPALKQKTVQAWNSTFGILLYSNSQELKNNHHKCLY